jgi:CHAD domain-containing protein
MLRRTLRTLPERPIPLRSGLDSEYRRGRQTLKRRGARIALEQLTATREKLVELPAADAEAASAIAGIGKVYRSGRKALWKARHTDDQALHAWRKQSKYLLNQLELLKSVFNVRFKKLRRRADQLAEALGDDHDLAVFISKLRLYEPQARPLGKYIKKRRRKLQARALRLGKQLYRHLAKHIEAASRRSCREPTKARLGGGDRADFR